MSKQVWIIIAGAVLFVVLLAAFISNSHGVVQVRAEKAIRETIINTIQTNGKIEPVDNFEAHAPAATTVKKVLVAEGDHVHKGQLLLQLDDADARAASARALAQMRAAEADVAAVHGGGTRQEVLSTQSQLAKARIERDRAQRNVDTLKRLQQTGSASAAEVGDAESHLTAAQTEFDLLTQQLKSRYSRPEVSRAVAEKAQAQAAYAAAQDTLRDSNVTAPQDGMVYSLPVRKGQYVNPGDLLLQVANLAAVQVRAFVDEPDIGRLAKGQQVTLTWDAIPGRSWQGTVTRVPTTVSVIGTRTVGEVTCQVDNADLKLLPNVNVNVTVMTARHDGALTVSREAMHQEGNTHYVYQVVDGVLKRRDVDTSISNLTRIEITKGLQDGAQVALGATNSFPLIQNERVQVVER